MDDGGGRVHHDLTISDVVVVVIDAEQSLRSAYLATSVMSKVEPGKRGAFLSRKFHETVGLGKYEGRRA